MPAFFAAQRGSVVRVDGLVQGGVMPFTIRMQGTDIGGVVNQTTRAIITQAGVIENGSYQFQHTLDETIYAYVFGDRIGELKVGGMCFMKLCPGSDSAGAVQVIDAYRINRIAARGLVMVNFGSVLYRGFLVGMTVEVTDPENNLGQWGFRFSTLRS